MKNETFRTKHFNIVINSRHGACLLFDRKGLGIYQLHTPRARFFAMRKSVSLGLNKTLLSLRNHVKYMIDAQKPHLSLRSR